MSTTVTPWWEALKLRPEIVDASGAIDDVQMSLHDAVYGKGTSRPVYAQAGYYGEITHPTGQLADLLAKLAVRLGGGPEDYVKARALTRLDQGMGGGKSHACIGAWHLAEHASEFSGTDIGKAVHKQAADILGRALPADLGRPRVVVLPCDSMTPGAPVQELDGPAKSLWERFLWRLFDKDYARYEDYRPYFNDKSKVVDALRSVGRPVLIIVDEILNYVGNGLDGAGDPELVAKDMGFLQVLLDAVNDVPNVAMLLVMIASEKDTMALSDGGAKRRESLQSFIDRNGRLATVNENADFAAILRRRLFDNAPAKEVVDATVESFGGVLRDKGWKSKVLDQIAAPWVSDFAGQVARAYPFHPQLMHLAESEWANLAGFQKVRSTIQVFAATVWALQKRGKAGEWVPALIGPGDLPLSDATVREAVLGTGLISDTKTQANYRAVAQNDIVSLDETAGAARLLDLGRDAALWGKFNPRAAERAATMVFLASIVGARGQGRRGASDPETKAATMVAGVNYGIADADGVIRDLADPDTGLAALEQIKGTGGTPPRYYLSTRQTLNMLARASRSSVTDADRDKAIADAAERLSTTGPFRAKAFVRAEPGTTPLELLVAAGLDDARRTRLVVLDPAAFSLRNGMEQDTVDALEAAVGLGPDRLTSSWASSLVFAVVNTQRRAHARAIAVEYLAWERVLDAPEVQADDDLREKARGERNEAKRRMETALKRAYQHVAYLSQPDLDAERELGLSTFDDDAQSSLDGALVWKSLVLHEKAYDQGDFTAKALLHQLRDRDYGRPLSEIRDAFWQAPRLPLLHSGEPELRHAIYDAVKAGDLRIVNRDGSEVAVTGPNEINLQSQSLSLAKPQPDEPEPAPDDADDTPSPGPAPVPGPQPDATKPGLAQPPATVVEKEVALSIIKRFGGEDEAIDTTAALLRCLYEAIEANGSSYLQGTLRIIVDSATADTIATAAKAAGVTAVIRDQ